MMSELIVNMDTRDCTVLDQLTKTVEEDDDHIGFSPSDNIGKLGHRRFTNGDDDTYIGPRQGVSSRCSMDEERQRGVKDQKKNTHPEQFGSSRSKNVDRKKIEHRRGRTKWWNHRESKYMKRVPNCSTQWDSGMLERRYVRREMEKEKEKGGGLKDNSPKVQPPLGSFPPDTLGSFDFCHTPQLSLPRFNCIVWLSQHSLFSLSWSEILVSP